MLGSMGSKALWKFPLEIMCFTSCYCELWVILSCLVCEYASSWKECIKGSKRHYHIHNLAGQSQVCGCGRLDWDTETFLCAHLFQVKDLVLHFLQCSEQFSLAQSGLLQLGLQVGHKLIRVLEKQTKVFLLLHSLSLTVHVLIHLKGFLCHKEREKILPHVVSSKEIQRKICSETSTEKLIM